MGFVLRKPTNPFAFAPSQIKRIIGEKMGAEISRSENFQVATIKNPSFLGGTQSVQAVLLVFWFF
jgi:hypothetical protein